MSLQDMLDTQRELQEVFDERATSPVPGQESCEYIKDMAISTMAELFELMDETGWKPWSSSWHVNLEAARGEWIDAWHFMMNLANKLGMSAEIIESMYEDKAQVNRQRMEDGYDGLNKCPHCKRALDDPGVTCSDASGVWVCMNSRVFQ